MSDPIRRHYAGHLDRCPHITHGLPCTCPPDPCPGLPDADQPCGDPLLPSDTAGLCIHCHITAALSHGIPITDLLPREAP